MAGYSGDDRIGLDTTCHHGASLCVDGTTLPQGHSTDLTAGAGAAPLASMGRRVGFNFS